MLLQMLLVDERVLETIAERLDVAWLSDSVASQTIQVALRLYNGRQWNGPNALFNQKHEQDVGQLVSELLLDQRIVKHTEKAAADCLATMEKHWLERLRNELRKQQLSPGLSAAKIAELQKQRLDLDSKLRHIAAFLMGKQ